MIERKTERKRDNERETKRKREKVRDRKRERLERKRLHKVALSASLYVMIPIKILVLTTFTIKL